MTKRQRNVSNISKELRPIAVVVACIPLLVCVMFTGCGLTDGHKHTGPVTIYQTGDDGSQVQVCPEKTTCFIGGGYHEHNPNKYQFVRQNGEVFVMLFDEAYPNFREGQKLDDIEYADMKDNRRQFIKAVLHR